MNDPHQVKVALAIFENQAQAAPVHAPILRVESGNVIFHNHVSRINFVAIVNRIAHPKALIDRAQAYWYLKRNQDPGILALPPRQAHALLIAARSKGEKLFQGSLSTLRYFFEPFNIDLAENIS